MARIVDLSKTIEYRKEDPWFMRIKVKHKPHKKAWFLLRHVLGLPRKLFPKGWTGWADDKIASMGVHATTHLDAPWHYHPTSGGKPAKSIDQVPLEWLYGPGVVVDMSHKPDFEAITVADIQQNLEKNGITLQKGNIVLIRTDRDQYKGEDFFEKGTGMSPEATQWLIGQGIRVMGIDQWGWDLPLKHQVKMAKETGQSDIFWGAHLVGRHREYLHMEQLTNLAALPPQGFKIAVFPLKIKGASAGPARVVAIFEDDGFGEDFRS